MDFIIEREDFSVNLSQVVLSRPSLSFLTISSRIDGINKPSGYRCFRLNLLNCYI